MPKTRVRPTREETADSLISAAVAVFQERGIGAATVEDIVRAAGLTRGAFYSSFANKDELVLAVLERQTGESERRNQMLGAKYSDPVELVNAIFSNEGRNAPFGSPTSTLGLELLLYAVRVPEHRAAAAALLRSMRTNIGNVAVASARAAGVTRPLDAEDVGAILLALEDGFDLHHMIDPDGVSPDSYRNALTQLQQLILDAPRDHSDQ